MSIFYECKQNVMQVKIFFYFRCKCLLQGCKCEMSIWCTCLLSEMQFSWCRYPMQGCGCKVYPWWCQRTCLIVMQMSPCRDVDAKCLVVQMPSNGYVMMQMLFVGVPWCECPFVGMSWCKCPFGANTNYSKIPFIFKTRLSQSLKPKYF